MRRTRIFLRRRAAGAAARHARQARRADRRGCAHRPPAAPAQRAARGAVAWRAGVYVMSLGATKNGALTAEAVVFFDRTLVRDFELRRKRAGHLLSKSRYVAAQLLAYVESGIWKRNAERSNRLAARIATAAGAALLHPVEANEVFLALGDSRRETLRAAGFEFYDWGAPGAGEARFVVSWDQPDRDVDALCQALGRL